MGAGSEGVRLSQALRTSLKTLNTGALISQSGFRVNLFEETLQLLAAIRSPGKRSEMVSTFYLFQSALRRLLIYAPAQKLCAVAEPAAGEVIVLNFGDEFWSQRFPLC